MMFKLALLSLFFPLSALLQSIIDLFALQAIADVSLKPGVMQQLLLVSAR